MTYAAGLDAAVIVWISPDVREEHREALDWLNRRTDDRLEFFGVSLEAIQIDNSKPAVQFRLVAFPNAWAKTVTTESRGEISEKRLRYRDFFQGVIDELREKHAFTNARVAQPQNWCAFGSGITGVTYGASFAAGERVRAELYIDLGTATQNKSVFDRLEARKDDIEQKTGKLEWQRLDQKKACRISLVRPNTSIDMAVAQSDDVRAWLVHGLLTLKSAFGPLLGAVTRDLPANLID